MSKKPFTQKKDASIQTYVGNWLRRKKLLLKKRKSKNTQLQSFIPEFRPKGKFVVIYRYKYVTMQCLFFLLFFFSQDLFRSKILFACCYFSEKKYRHKPIKIIQKNISVHN